jgi:hypothetical protein
MDLDQARLQSILYKLQCARWGAFKFELLPLHSPLLGQSLLVSFPPLIDMLKFSGYPYLIRGQTFDCGYLTGRPQAPAYFATLSAGDNRQRVTGGPW